MNNKKWKVEIIGFGKYTALAPTRYRAFLATYKHLHMTAPKCSVYPLVSAFLVNPKRGGSPRNDSLNVLMKMVKEIMEGREEVLEEEKKEKVAIR